MGYAELFGHLRRAPLTLSVQKTNKHHEFRPPAVTIASYPVNSPFAVMPENSGHGTRPPV
jgi:hypothetical protein